MSGILAILTSVLIWGAAPPIFKFALEGIPPFTLAFIRFFGAGLIFLPFVIAKWKKPTTRQWIYIILGALTGIVINISAFFVGLQFAPSINVHVISSVGSLVLYALSILVLHERPHPQVLRGMIIAFVGVVIAMGIDTQELFGNMLFVIAMLSMSLNAVINKKVIGQFDSALFTGIQFMIGAIPFFFLMLYEAHSSYYDWSISTMNMKAWIGIIFGVLFSSGLAYWAYNYALKKLSAQEVGVFAYIKPIIAVLVAIPLLGEYPDVYFVVGTILVFLGIYISERHPHYQRVRRKIHK